MRRSEADEEFSARRGTVAPADDGLKVELKTRKIVFNGAVEPRLSIVSLSSLPEASLLRSSSTSITFGIRFWKDVECPPFEIWLSAEKKSSGRPM